MSKKQGARKPVPVVPKPLKPHVSVWDRIEQSLEKKQLVLEISLCTLFILFALLLFDVKISVGSDDSAYIERGYNLLKEGIIPFFQGPLYPTMLSVFIGIFGINIVALKFVSFFVAVLQQVVLFFVLRKRIPNVVLFLFLFFIATNGFIQFYSSQTYTEAFFLFLQAITMYFVFHILDRENEGRIIKDYKGWIMVGLMIMLLSLCKSVAIVCFIPLILYFLIKRKWLNAGLAFGSYLFWKIVYEVGMRVFYQAPDIGQFKQNLLKDFYKPSEGYEDLAGLVARFMANVHTYFSMQIFRILELRSPTDYLIIPPLSYLVGALLIACVVYLYKKNKYLFFIGIYTMILYGGIFIGIQANNMQDRLIIIAIPFTYLIIASTGYYLSKRYSALGIPIILFFVILTFAQLGNTLRASVKNIHVLKKNLKGDIYYGFTDDWSNYLKMSRWCADSLPPSSYVACRKASMSFVYGKGKKFFGINVVRTTDPDSVLADLKSHKVTHVLVANLRKNPTVNNGQVVNTLQRMLYPVYTKYPQKLKHIKNIGENTEPADVYEILY